MNQNDKPEEVRRIAHKWKIPVSEAILLYESGYRAE